MALPIDELRKSLHRIAGATPSKAWAERILNRAAFGESFPAIALTFARQALAVAIERNPGEDDETNYGPCHKRPVTKGGEYKIKLPSASDVREDGRERDR